MKKKKIIYIQWADAVSAPDKWWADSKVAGWIKEGSFVVEQVGFLIEETERYIVLAAMSVDDSKYNEGLKGHVHKIPKGWIIKRKNL